MSPLNLNTLQISFKDLPYTFSQKHNFPLNTNIHKENQPTHFITYQIPTNRLHTNPIYACKSILNWYQTMNQCLLLHSAKFLLSWTKECSLNICVQINWTIDWCLYVKNEDTSETMVSLTFHSFSYNLCWFLGTWWRLSNQKNSPTALVFLRTRGQNGTYFMALTHYLPWNVSLPSLNWLCSLLPYVTKPGVNRARELSSMEAWTHILGSLPTWTRPQITNNMWYTCFCIVDLSFWR